MNTQMINTDQTNTTGRYIVTFREGENIEAAASLRRHTGLTNSRMVSTAEFGTAGIDLAQADDAAGIVLDHLGIAVVTMDTQSAGAMELEAGDRSPILSIEPEGIMYASNERLAFSADYLRGFRDSAQALIDRFDSPSPYPENNEAAAGFDDTPGATWGLQATKVINSRFSGSGKKIAVLDTGFDMAHPDFAGRSIVAKSFVPGVTSPADGHGHGTHCIGTACGPLKPPTGQRYGIAFKSQIYAGKVLSDQGFGADGGILAAIDWAIANGCEIVSMSLGAPSPTSTIAYETAGQRALDAGTLIVAAAGNNAKRTQNDFGFVERPANSRSIMSVGAIDNSLRIANFSARDTTRTAGTAVDICGPGVAVNSAWTLPDSYRTISGTSMATPHVAGIAALWAEATGAVGSGLWQRLIVSAKTLSLPTDDVGRGLVQAP